MSSGQVERLIRSDICALCTVLAAVSLRSTALGLSSLATSLRSVAHSRLHIYSSTPLNSLHLPGWAALRSCCLSMRRLMALRNASTYVSYLKISE